MPLDVLFGTSEGPSDAKARAAELSAAYQGRSPDVILRAALFSELPRRKTALVSSFGAESALLLARVAVVDPGTPVVFLDTGKHFDETLAYRDALIARLGLTDVRIIRPEPADLSTSDPNGELHQQDTDACCHIRKVLPLERALKPFDAWITGRKRSQSAERSSLQLFEAEASGRLKVNPLADWTTADVERAVRRLDLPPHPLVAQGFPSIGCGPCTSKVKPGEDARAGRWRGSNKNECGIHFENGRIRRSAA